MKRKIATSLFMVLLVSSFAYSQNYYLGVGDGTGQQGYSCSSCHISGNIGKPVFDTWKLTKHAQAYDSLKNILSYSCLSCHTTGWDTANVNYGADEYVVKDTSKHQYAISNAAGFSLVKNIQCETCHGAMGTKDHAIGTDHWGFGTTNSPNYSASLCGSCHSGHSPYYEQWQLSKHAQSTSGACVITPKIKTCTKCHVAQNFAAYAKNPTTYKDTILVSGTDVQPLTCVACHDPHDAKYPGQLRFDISPSQVVCDKCHYADIDSVNINTTPHETTGPCLTGDPLFGFRYAGKSYINSAHTYAATERCVNCHVNMTPNADGGVNTGHTFEARVQACASCHSDYYSSVDTSNHAKMFDYRGVQSTTDSLINTLQAILKRASHADSATTLFKEANYNLNAITGEGSHGIHNTRLVQKLLKDAIASFSTTAVQNQEQLPTKFDLTQNYPNPFNPTTTIRFSLPQSGNVKITIYDVTGKQVQVIVNSYYNRGTFTVNWNAGSFASGVYLYRIEAGSFNMVKKMVLLK